MTNVPMVPYMVDASRDPIDFKMLDKDRVTECATRTKCGVCGQRINRGPIAFIGPNDGRRCFADPWMHPVCAEESMRRCPFLSGRRDWSEVEARSNPLLAIYSSGMAVVLAFLATLYPSWRAARVRPAEALRYE